MVLETAAPLVVDLGTLQPLYELVQPLLLKASLLVGGIFGIYLILVILRVYYDQKILKTLKQIRYDLDQHNIKLGIPSSLERHGPLKQVWHHLSQRQKVKKKM